MVADSMENASFSDCRQDLLNKECQENSTDGSEIEIMDEEEPLQLERLSVAHEFSPAQNHRIIRKNKDGGFLQRGHGRLPSDKVEIIGRVADDSFEDLVEVGV